MRGEFAALGAIFVAQDDPESGPVGFVLARTDGAGELREFEARAAEKFREDAASVIDEIAKALRNKYGVDVARRRVLELVEIVIGQRLFQRDFDGGGRLVFVSGDSNGHGGYGFTPRGLFRIGAAGENGKRPIKLFREHDAGEFVGESHGAEGKFVLSALRKAIGKAVGVAAEEDEFASAPVAKLAEPFGKRIRIKILSTRVKNDDRGCAISIELLQSRITVADFSDFDRA